MIVLTWSSSPVDRAEDNTAVVQDGRTVTLLDLATEIGSVLTESHDGLVSTGHRIVTTDAKDIITVWEVKAGRPSKMDLGAATGARWSTASLLSPTGRWLVLRYEQQLVDLDNWTSRTTFEARPIHFSPQEDRLLFTVERDSDAVRQDWNEFIPTVAYQCVTQEPERLPQAGFVEIRASFSSVSLLSHKRFCVSTASARISAVGSS